MNISMTIKTTFLNHIDVAKKMKRDIFFSNIFLIPFPGGDPYKENKCMV